MPPMPPLRFSVSSPLRFCVSPARRLYASRALRLSASSALLVSVAACASLQKPPEIALDDPAEFTPAVIEAEAPKPVEIVRIPTPLPLPGQLQPPPRTRPLPPEPASPRARVEEANREARVQPRRAGYINAIQVFPFTEGALYQVYTTPGRVTDIALQEGEELVEQGAVAAGDTARWVIGDTVSGDGPRRRVHILVKPVRADLPVNTLVINTKRRTYHVELHPTDGTYMAAVSWDYPQDRLYALQQQNRQAEAAQPVAQGVEVDRLRFRYALSGDNPSWRPVNVFDDGAKVYIEFPRGIGQGEMPPLFVIGPEGQGQLVNYRVRGRHMIVDRLFAAAELRLGGRGGQKAVRIERTDGRPAS